MKHSRARARSPGCLDTPGRAPAIPLLAGGGCPRAGHLLGDPHSMPRPSRTGRQAFIRTAPAGRSDSSARPAPVLGGRSGDNRGDVGGPEVEPSVEIPDDLERQVLPAPTDGRAPWRAPGAAGCRGKNDKTRLGAFEQKRFRTGTGLSTHGGRRRVGALGPHSTQTRVGARLSAKAAAGLRRTSAVSAASAGNAAAGSAIPMVRLALGSRSRSTDRAPSLRCSAQPPANRRCS